MDSPVKAYDPSQCTPCPAGTYVNADTGGACEACATGYTSPSGTLCPIYRLSVARAKAPFEDAGAHHCVVLCPTAVDNEKCAPTGAQCATMDLTFSSLTQTSLSSAAQSTSVQQNGGVYYTDAKNIYYYFDTCTPQASLHSILG